MEFSYLRTILLIATAGLAFGDSLGTIHEVDLKDNETLLLNCSLLREGPIKWTFQNDKLSEDFAEIFKNGTLLVQRPGMGHFGRWTCSNGTHSIHYSVSIKMKARVRNIAVSPSKRVSRGTKLKVTCVAIGSLPIHWRWFKNGAPLLHSDGRKIDIDMNWVQLQLNRSSTVECEAKNQHGHERRAVTIVVTNSLPPPPSPTTQHVPTTTPRPVECLPYRGSVCKGWLPEKHQWAFDAASQPALDLAARERTGRSLLSAVDAAGQFRKSNASCAGAVRALLCGLLFPACARGARKASGRPWKPAELCREHCVAVDQLFCPHGSAGRVLEAVRSGFANGSAERAVVTLGAAPCAGLPQWSRLQATGGVEAEAEAPLCTAVRLEAHVGQEDAINVCYKGRGEAYRGAVAHFRAPSGGPKQACARWVSKHARAVMQAEGYSLAAFPSLATSGQACRNPAGLKKAPVCVPRNPTMKTLVRCDIMSCSEILSRPPDPPSIDVFGWKLAETKFYVIIIVIAFVFIALGTFAAYCCCCRHIAGNRRTRLLRAEGRLVEKNATANTPAQSVVNSEFDLHDAKSCLLTPNQDYHGKALTDFISPKLQKLEYPREDIVDLKELGRGAFGDVFLVEAPQLDEERRRRSEGDAPVRQRIAMKVLKSDATPEMQLQFLREATMLADLEHENIVRLIGVSLIYKPFCMLMEYMCHGDLNSYLRRHDPNNTAVRVDIDQAAVAMHGRPNGHMRGSVSISETGPPVELNRLVLCKMAMEIAEGMIYLSHQNYVHRDLATRNCLLDIDKKVKIADFGLCRRIKRGEDFIDDDNGAMPVRWMPLEAILERRFNLDTDVWSFGVLLWELFSFALQPYFGKSHEEVIAYLQKGSVLDKPPDAPDAAYVLMLRCWSRQRRERPSFAFLKRQLTELHRRWMEAANKHVTT